MGEPGFPNPQSVPLTREPPRNRQAPRAESSHSIGSLGENDESVFGGCLSNKEFARPRASKGLHLALRGPRRRSRGQMNSWVGSGRSTCGASDTASRGRKVARRSRSSTMKRSEARGTNSSWLFAAASIEPKPCNAWSPSKVSSSAKMAKEPFIAFTAA